MARSTNQNVIEAVGVEIRGTQPYFTTHAYIQFLLATAQNASYEEAYTVLYSAEKAYHDSWTVVRDGLDPTSPWWPFVENWAGPEFGAYVSYLEAELDKLAAEAGPERLERIEQILSSGRERHHIPARSKPARETQPDPR